MKKIIIKSVILLALFFTTGVLYVKAELPTDITQSFLPAEITESAEETKEEIAQPDDGNGMYIPAFHLAKLPGIICISNYAESTIQFASGGVFQPPR